MPSDYQDFLDQLLKVINLSTDINHPSDLGHTVRGFSDLLSHDLKHPHSDEIADYAAGKPGVRDSLPAKLALVYRVLHKHRFPDKPI